MEPTRGSPPPSGSPGSGCTPVNLALTTPHRGLGGVSSDYPADLQYALDLELAPHRAEFLRPGPTSCRTRDGRMVR
jgi:hypothetical protein